MASGCTGRARAESEAELVQSFKYLYPASRLAHKLAAFGGTLYGLDGGEWGGALVFRDRDGRSSKLYAENILGIVNLDGRVLVFSGLAHMDVNQGVVLELQHAAGGTVTVRGLARLPGAPLWPRQVDAQTVVFEVFAGHDNHSPVYLCKSYVYNVISSSDRCKR
ncbi:hypothetical protein ACLB1G_05255 [Oxalobacteraceae bacterium A2-2]